ncbi:hypothetical protein BRYFOR_08632 [Marvinbryantia formatexigens DSM 14469]|uniref:Uncharacterized protein n=1 Tax=Marvinbryantia formatexigens DSM 14469 TaxID=478749 RepID=C6LIZ8_9FIRM|nr:hypothetical protein [Marvinbryantia formatexigens]EET59318.1 hypothetical protein BRYFOR_08632 [Marvinbryantia formatexigens DSM 14469]UWO24406.1 hypothetical protein NQ534_18610 [Marvinbryantia formatexigens DSM 14469]SDF49950.1 hypothetical protein SAMN05660368_00783 [Marvinbryantia formatexigens]
MGSNDTPRILIETIVRKTLKDIKASPRRSTRNLVDMALNFSEGRFQRNFFETAQKMLENGQSPYYALIQDTVAHVDTERLLQFGMNLGYNGCTVGAKKIRETEEKEHYNIPWMLSFYFGPEQLPGDCQTYQSAISAGEKLGIHVWMLKPEGCAQEALALVREHRKSAFALFCSPQEITEEFLREVREINNLMIVVHYGKDMEAACRKLRENGLLYALHYTYTQEETEKILDGGMFEEMQQLYPAVSMLSAAPGCPENIKEEIYEYVKKAREEQLFRTVVWEADYDSLLVDGIISQDAALAWFDTEGCLVTLEGRKEGADFRLSQRSLPDILKQAFPKK